jgi:hypothetical protein
MVYGGAGSDDNGNYIEPTVLEEKDPFLRPFRRNFLSWAFRLCFMKMKSWRKSLN